MQANGSSFCHPPCKRLYRDFLVLLPHPTSQKSMFNRSLYILKVKHSFQRKTLNKNNVVDYSNMNFFILNIIMIHVYKCIYFWRLNIRYKNHSKLKSTFPDSYQFFELYQQFTPNSINIGHLQYWYIKITTCHKYIVSY